MKPPESTEDGQEVREVDTFAGFAPPTRNYFMMPNEWTDITAGIESLAELKVVEYVLRHTWGFHEFGICKTISIDEFMHGRKKDEGKSRMDRGTGLKSDRSVKDGLKLAIAHGYLICTIDESDQARIKKSYALKIKDGCELPTKRAKKLPGVDSTPGSNYPSGPTLLPPGGANSTPRSEKDTLERHLEKDTLTYALTPSSFEVSAQEKRAITMFCQAGGKSGRFTGKLLESYTSLAALPLDQPKMDKLFAYAKKRCDKMENSRVYPANLVAFYDDWMREEEASKSVLSWLPGVQEQDVPSQPEQTPSYVDDTSEFDIGELEEYRGHSAEWWTEERISMERPARQASVREWLTRRAARTLLAG